MVDLQTVSIVIASISVVVGVIYYAWLIRNQNKLRQTDLTLRLVQQFSDNDFMNSWAQAMARDERVYEEYIKKYGSIDLFRISVFFEGVGFLVHRKLLDIDLAMEMWADPVVMMWEKIGDILKRLHSDKAFWFEYLYNEVKKRKQRR